MLWSFLCNTVSKAPHENNSGTSCAFQALICVLTACDTSLVVTFAPQSQEAALWGNVLSQLFVGRLCVQPLQSALVFELPNHCKSCLYWIWRVVSQKQAGTGWRPPGVVVQECCLAWAYMVSDFYGQVAVGDCTAYYHCLRQLLPFPGTLCEISLHREAHAFAFHALTTGRAGFLLVILGENPEKPY